VTKPPRRYNRRKCSLINKYLKKQITICRRMNLLFDPYVKQNTKNKLKMDKNPSERSAIMNFLEET
jgi:hypothetical protein